MNNIITNQIINQLMQSPRLKNNEIALNAVQMYRSGNSKEVFAIRDNLFSGNNALKNNLSQLEDEAKKILGMNQYISEFVRTLKLVFSVCK